MRLENCSSVRSQPVDLSPLAELGLHELGIRTMVDLESLAGARLSSLSLRGGALSDSAALPPGLQVERLSLAR